VTHQKKGLIVAFTIKVAYIANGVTTHSTLHLPTSTCNIMPLTSNTLDTLTIEYEQFRVFIIGEASLIGSQLVHNIDK